MLNRNVSTYFPRFLWKFWLSKYVISQSTYDDPSTNPLHSHQLQPKLPRVHIYDVYANELTEVNESPSNEPSIFHQFNFGVLDPNTRYTLEEAESAFSRLEREVESVLREILDYTVWSGRSNSAQSKNSLVFSRISIEALRKYFVFIRFRNSSGYQETISALEEAYQSQPDAGSVTTAFQHVIVQHRLRFILREITRFLNSWFKVDPTTGTPIEEAVPSAANDKFTEVMDMFCWSMMGAEVSFGIAEDEQEFILSDRCFGTLEGEPEDDHPSCSLFFPIVPTMALYLLGDLDDFSTPSYSNLKPTRRCVYIDVGQESSIDVFLRNATVLQSYPQYLFFQSLRTVALSISSYEEFRSPQHLDYSRLKQRCRQKFLQETVTKTLTVKGSLILTDLTDEVVVIGDSAVCHGSFSDVWKGTWEDPIERKQRVVALKFLRPVMVKGVREKLLQRLQTEVVAWHRLCHKNISQLFGIVQSPHSVGMVSQWCENGTLSHYLKENSEVNGLKLLAQVASGIAYLHQMNIIHGDLKGGNILVDELGNAVITDFGLSKVIEEITDTMNKGTSFFAGSTRWMAPELLFALVEDDGVVPAITTFSDIYAFASVCLEIASGLLPYPHRSNDHAVTVDILRGIRPCRSTKCLLKLNPEGEQAFWNILDQCWDHEPRNRPTMPHMVSFLEVLEMSSRLLK
ncbi:kinase-like domain-containing protein [Crepidotus variabilis]|uniref:Kinase-like domain-containing protein n=1 Tax=Crepidotus variabilis TaxID=179855 RepID=A0A9P6JRE4_9AGAR|nr:kinase-like domain-containing protein [Crepidotus variabilis]